LVIFRHIGMLDRIIGLKGWFLTKNIEIWRILLKSSKKDSILNKRRLSAMRKRLCKRMRKQLKNIPK
jgi:hypothetical protein